MKRRRFLYIPEINADTFLFFYFRGTSGRSYSFRDYSSDAGVVVTYGRDLPYTVDEILAMALYDCDAPRVSTKDRGFWRDRIRALNQKYLPAHSDAAHKSETARPMSPSSALSARVPKQRSPARESLASAESRLADTRYPILALERLLSHPVKSNKKQDLDRILRSGGSEDYVTWNIAQLLSILNTQEWWPALLNLAKLDNPKLELQYRENDLPRLALWQQFPAPAEYVRRSRQRMADSTNAKWRERARNPRPVEGKSEIDLVLSGNKYVIFAEAKLDSDVSPRTTYDPDRNQIVRNIDVLIDQAGVKMPVFWMLVRDVDPSRDYVQLMRQYREEPNALHRVLPQRSAGTIRTVARNLAFVLWSDLLEKIEKLAGSVFRELGKRVRI